MGNNQVICGKFVGPETPGQTRVLRNANLEEGAELTRDFQGLATIPALLKNAAKKFPKNDCFGTRRKEGDEYKEYVWTNFETVYERSQGIAKNLFKRGLCPSKDCDEGKFKFIALYSKNREEWCQVDLAASLCGVTVVTLYDTLGKSSIEFIIDQTQLETVALSGDKLKSMLAMKQEGLLNSVKSFLYFDQATEEDKAKAQELGVELLAYEEFLAEGLKIDSKDADYEAADPVDADTFYTFSYTSGTTGVPKGVMLTHRNFVANVGALNQFDGGQFAVLADDVYVSYLPLAHVFERFMYLAMVAHGVGVGFYHGDVFKLKDDLAELKPTLMISVPRLFNRFYDAMQQKVNELTGFKRTVADWGIQKKLYNYETSAAVTHGFYDSLVFNKFRAVLGGRVRQMITGSAPISKDTLNFLKIAFCCQINEGFGQTESAAPASLTWTNDPLTGHVGGPYPACDFKLVDLPDMGYTAKDTDEQGNPMPRGEICYKGWNCFKGYFRNPAATAEAIDSQGWVHTGDVGTILPHGGVKIIDRKKNIFKLSQGEYVVPEKLENKFCQHPLIAQCFVYGDSLQNFLVTVIVPDKEPLEAYAKEKGISGELLQKDEIVGHFLAELKRVGKEAGFFGFEIPQKAHLTANAFSVENEILTPTFKLKRNDAKKAFYSEIKQMYGGAKLQGEEE